MLQQTQVVTVLPYYDKWLRRFPTFAALAQASESDVLHAWQGLGYYGRARNLHAAAKLVVNRHHGQFPFDFEAAQKLPGIGRYSANAVASFAFDFSVPIVEANTARLLARLCDVTAPIDSSSGRIALWDSATRLVPKRNAGAFNSALIDLGALICRPKPRCDICPVKSFCQAPNPELLPIKKMRRPLEKLTETHVFAVRQNEVLLEQSTGRWRGMWILPALKRERIARQPLYVSTFPFTHHRVTLRVFGSASSRLRNCRQHWFGRGALQSIPIPSPHRRALVALLDH
ncbi:MAG: A/G-specific adenine glycosylase [Verrucomicrobiota bacterium]